MTVHIRHFAFKTDVKGGCVFPTQKGVALGLKEFQRLFKLQKQLAQEYDRQMSLLFVGEESRKLLFNTPAGTTVESTEKELLSRAAAGTASDVEAGATAGAPLPVTRKRRGRPVTRVEPRPRSQRLEGGVDVEHTTGSQGFVPQIQQQPPHLLMLTKSQ